MKALFIPLKREFYEDFEARRKHTEFRKLGPRWNTGTCVPGRPVTLSLGYGKKHRLSGVIRFVRIYALMPQHQEAALKSCYGETFDGPTIGIGIELDNGKDARKP